VGFWLCEAGSLTRKENIMKFLDIMSNAIFLKGFKRTKVLSKTICEKLLMGMKGRSLL
jgi:uncharacterized membrane protein